MRWYPHDGPQLEFCSRGEFEVLFGGAAGPGKTDCLIMEALRHIEEPDYNGILFRRTFPQLQEIIDRCWIWYPQLGGQYKASEHRWFFPSGAKIALSHMQHESNKYDHQGKQYHFCGFDELTQFSETQYLYIHSRVRGTNPRVPLSIRSTTNPGGIGHVWVKKRFVDVGEPGKAYIDPETGQSRCFIPATVYANPTLIDNDPLYVRRLEALPEIEKLRLLHGVWDVFEGQVFTELSQRVHGCDPFPVPPEWEHFMVFDWGYSRPWCALWFAVDYDNVLYLYREHYGMVGNDPNRGARQTNTEICRVIQDTEKEKIRFRVADPACWSPTKIKGSNQVLGPSFVEDAAKEGLYFLKADNDRLRGKQQIHQRFQLDTETDDQGQVVDERPRFVAFNSCQRWWEEIQQLREDPKNTEDVDTNQPDEGYDCTRYACMSRPIVPKRIERVPPGSFMAERNRLIRAKQYARRHGTSLAAAYARVR